VSHKISDSTIRRLSVYLRLLEDLEVEGTATVSSETLARQAGATAAQIRKDLSLFGSFGKRGMGYSVAELATRVRGILGLARQWRVALVGAGRIGSALFAYPNLSSRGFHIVTVVDSDPEKVGRRWGEVWIRPDDELERAIQEEQVDMAILAVPGHAAQAVMDRVVAAGVRGILNFAPVPLRVPEDVWLKDVNLVIEMEALSYALSQEAPD
jgi:redox-sensing transcriptional repressor